MVYDDGKEKRGAVKERVLPGLLNTLRTWGRILPPS